ncbi:MAG: hypothetical protein NVSMB64_10220 [Candidatus Velthaea sp.]
MPRHFSFWQWAALREHSNNHAPVVEYGVEATNCLYMVSPGGGIVASVWLGRGPAARMLAAHRAYAKVPQSRHGGEGLRGNT